jgi:hypothetical protein
LKIAKLLENSKVIPPPDEIIQINDRTFVNSTELLSLQSIIAYKRPKPLLDCRYLKVLEFTRNISELKSDTSIKSLHLIYHNYSHDPCKWDNIKILDNINNSDNNYDIIVFNEYLEMIERPINLLTTVRNKLNPNGKIFIRFRPWSASNGGFQEDHNIYLPYAHILTKEFKAESINNKVVRPLQTYNRYLTESGLSIISQFQHRYHSPLPPRLFEIVCGNLWGSIPREDAARILLIHNVDYLLSP